MLRNDLATAIASAVQTLIAAGSAPDPLASVEVEIVETKNPDHGDYTCNLAMVAAKRVGMNPRQLAELLQRELAKDDRFTAVDVAGPGFLNFRLQPEAISAYLPAIRQAGRGIGKSQTSRPLKINVEFVSVNPNGPITIGSGRGAAFGSTLCNVLAAAGHEVHREYYINDGVNSEQMRLFALSVLKFLASEATKGIPTIPVGDHGAHERFMAELHQHFSEMGRVPMQTQDRTSLTAWLAKHYPQVEEVDFLWDLYQLCYLDGEFKSLSDRAYPGDYVYNCARMIYEKVGRTHLLVHVVAEPANLDWVRVQSQEAMLEQQRSALADFGVVFDTWFSEQSLHDSGVVEEKTRALLASGAADERPVRTKLKLGKGGKIEDVEIESQDVVKDEDDELGTPLPSREEGAPEGAGTTLWLRSTKFGDDMDRVLRRRDGRLTYITSDVAYHADKFNRPADADKLITILGPDHHGYIGRLHAVLAALYLGETEVPASDEPLSETDAKLYATPEERDRAHAALARARKNLEVIIYQLVRFLKDGKPAPMRKRDGNIYELRDLVTELGERAKPNGSDEEKITAGRDIARFYYLMRSHDTTMDFDLDQATQQSDDNPVFYIQYAHARICGVLRKAEEAGISLGEFDPKLLQHPRELNLLKKIMELPDEVRRCAEDYAVNRLGTYAIELARAYHAFYDACRVIQPDEPALTQARLNLCRAVADTLAGTLDLLGISDPERMERE